MAAMMGLQYEEDGHCLALSGHPTMALRSLRYSAAYGLYDIGILCSTTTTRSRSRTGPSRQLYRDELGRGDTLSNKLQGESTLIKLVYAHLPALEEYGTTHLRARSRSQTNNTEPRRRVQGIQTPQSTTQNRTSKMTPKRNPNQKWHQNDTKRKSKPLKELRKIAHQK